MLRAFKLRRTASSRMCGSQSVDIAVSSKCEVTVSLNYGIYFGFQFRGQTSSCSDEVEQVPSSFFTGMVNFDSKPDLKHKPLRHTLQE
ncbi:hypothetical protein AVEN_252535-1 [Araneus ventricosus]|uniref:Uncharacterized protein n=1 Tax=Araneus ventricosus TaxID=182803 RepID=A0A4Y2AR86_ARAVE|nr:hypothetical protein AVEN_252535-1 [Araneus ventricosus]